MSNEVEFNPEGSGGFNLNSAVRSNKVSGGWIMRLVMKLFGIQDEAKANQTLLVLTIVFLAAAGLILWSSL